MIKPPQQTKDQIIRDLEKRILALDDKVEMLQRDNKMLKSKTVMPRRLLEENIDLKKRIKAILKYATISDRP